VGRGNIVLHLAKYHLGAFFAPQKTGFRHSRKCARITKNRILLQNKSRNFPPCGYEIAALNGNARKPKFPNASND
jgi:hypothetical protein